MDIKLLTLNCWGYHSQSKKIHERLVHIANEVKRKDYDVVAFQEIWHKADYQLMVDALCAQLPHTYCFYNGNAGSGLCVFSKFPIVTVRTHPFLTHKGMFDIVAFSNEILLGKGCLCCRLKTPAGYIRLFVLHADVDYMHRMCQLYEAAQFVAEVSGEEAVVLCGDFNMIDSEYAYRIITEVLQMKDCFADTKEMTSDTLTNKWRTGQYPPARLDYVFLSNNGCRSLQLEVVSKGLSLNGLVPGLSYNFSDHEGLEVELRLTQPRTFSATEPRLMEHFSGGSLSPSALRTFKETLVLMNRYIDSHKNRIPFGFLTSSNASAYTTWALFAIISVLLILSPFQIPFYSAIVLGIGSLVTAASMAMLVDVRRRYRLRDLQGQIQTKLEGLSYMNAESTPYKS